ncbi:hypothetical protein Fcan01_22703 [Folsomia candida]|uniref:Ionotropic glutamate receptor C-terminal domain-containing protein n=1 Tax=Folsomia candida TaxID=158441 RepID=A0A226D9L7_FOLCA|nr:hypothetical protein Fcan01_22703 [Folsomia candida]
MTELIALLSEFGDLSPGSHIHIVTDQFNLETNFQPYFKIQTPNTFYKITNRSNILRKADYDDLPTISIQHIRASSILNMLVILVLSNPPEILDKSSNLPTTQVKKLSHAVNSGRNLLVPSIILRTEMFQGKQYFKGPFAIFWFTNWDPNDRFQFPRKSFFTRIKKSTQVKLGFHEQLDEMIEALAPTLYVGAQHDEIFKPYVSYGCQSKLKAKNTKVAGISEIVLCGSNMTIYHLTFTGLYPDVTHPDEDTQPIIYDEDYFMYRRSLHATRKGIAFSDHVFITGDKAFNFLTCWSESKYNFRIYVTPFHSALWICLLSTFIMMTLLLTMYLRSIQAEPLVSTWTLFFSNFVGQAYSLVGEVGTRLVVRIGLGSWFLVCVIFTQGYIGVLLNYVCAPLPQISVSYFDDVATPVCNYRQNNPNYQSVKKCPPNLWYNASLYVENAYHELNSESEFRLMSPPDHAVYIDYMDSLVSTVGPNIVTKYVSEVRQLGMHLTNFAKALADFAAERHFGYTAGRPRFDSIRPSSSAKGQNLGISFRSTTPTSSVWIQKLAVMSSYMIL